MESASRPGVNKRRRTHCKIKPWIQYAEIEANVLFQWRESNGFQASFNQFLAVAKECLKEAQRAKRAGDFLVCGRMIAIANGLLLSACAESLPHPALLDMRDVSILAVLISAV
jgi:hypothetical protein